MTFCVFSSEYITLSNQHQRTEFLYKFASGLSENEFSLLSSGIMLKHGSQRGAWTCKDSKEVNSISKHMHPVTMWDIEDWASVIIGL